MQQLRGQSSSAMARLHPTAVGATTQQIMQSISNNPSGGAIMRNITSSSSGLNDQQQQVLAKNKSNLDSINADDSDLELLR